MTMPPDRQNVVQITSENEQKPHLLIDCGVTIDYFMVDYDEFYSLASYKSISTYIEELFMYTITI